MGHPAAAGGRPPPADALHARDLTVVRGTRTVLRGLGFTVPRG
ncbi:ABC transporter ATP-binding protein, partial [Streptomyces antibioticus]